MKKSPTKTACVEMTGPAVQMDLIGDSYFEPANPLPVKCARCRFPDLDFVPRPYLLTKGISSPAETSPARLGNFLIRDRVRRILEVVVPNACTFHPTASRKDRKESPWWLAVPSSSLAIPVPEPREPFCPQCREPQTWSYAMGPVWEKMQHFNYGGVDVFKSDSWHSVKSTSRSTLSQALFFSVRLEQLFKRAKVKGQLVRSYYFRDVKLSEADEAWIARQLGLLVELGLAEAPKAKDSGAIKTWFKRFLTKNTKKGLKRIDPGPVEKKHGLTLPSNYKDFISKAGPLGFEDVMGIEGFTAKVLSPTKLDFKDYRSGRVLNLDEEQSKVDGVAFATTDHGDAFVFDVTSRNSDYPVFWHDHEQNTLEPFAANFAECIQRFAAKS